MSIRKRKSFKDMPATVKIIWSICLVIALIGLTLITLDITEVIEGNLIIEQSFCTVACLMNILMMTKFKDQLYEEE
ncbi:MAG: hypothetical protein J5842_05195 [Lachnospiraceae bacterium]|nr:hypothetical protein [Lachnospiraceae bacterium]